MTKSMRTAFSLLSISVGIAIFSMFFGAGNVVYPLILGQSTGEWVNFAILGFLITGIGGPLLGLLGTILYEGNCKQFFSRIGTVPAYLIVLLIIALIGPFGAMPRCFVVAYAAVKPYTPWLSLELFNVLSGILVLLCIVKRKFILPVLGLFLSPLLILSLVIIITKGIVMPHLPTVGLLSSASAALSPSAGTAFVKGLGTGFDTMDLLASIFFAVAIWDLLKEKLLLTNEPDLKKTAKALMPICTVASLVGGALLALIYVGLCKTAAYHMEAITQVANQEDLLSTLAIHILGPQFAFVANIAVALACLTTVISLAVTVADVIHVEFEAANRASYSLWKVRYSALITLIVVITVFFANQGFASIMGYIHPIVAVCYPAIIVLTICNILYRVFGFSYVKVPVYATLALTLAYRLLL